MSEFSNGRAKPWNIYSGLNPSPSQTDVNKDGPWKSYGSSMNAISFGFVATAILISMFLIMAIFEHLFRPTASSHDVSSHGMESRQLQKLGNPNIMQTSYASDFSVVMPGQQYPTFIAQPAPLPCQREGVHWPSHDHICRLNFGLPIAGRDTELAAKIAESNIFPNPTKAIQSMPNIGTTKSVLS